MIVSCPSCGTQFKRPVAASASARARCGRCDAAFHLAGLRPYRIRSVTAPIPVGVAAGPGTAPGAARPSIGLDDPDLAAAVTAPGPATAGASAMTWRIEAPEEAEPPTPVRDTWDETEPLPPIPEMRFDPTFQDAPPRFADRGAPEAREEGAVEPASVEAASAPTGLSAYLLWALGGAILGTGASWTLGGTTAVGVLAGGGAGLTAAWGWLRWTSRP